MKEFFARQLWLAPTEPCTVAVEARSPHRHAMCERGLAWKRSRAFALYRMCSHPAAPGHGGGARECGDEERSEPSGSVCSAPSARALCAVPQIQHRVLCCTQLCCRPSPQLLGTNAAGQCTTKAIVQQKRRLGPPRCLSEGDGNFEQSVLLSSN